MKYLKLYEEAKDFYLGDKKYIITTKDEKYVWYSGSELMIFVDIDILDEVFIDSFFLLKDKVSAENMINSHIPKYYKVYFSDVETFKKSLLGGKYIDRSYSKNDWFEEVPQSMDGYEDMKMDKPGTKDFVWSEKGDKWINPELEYKIIEYDMGGYRKTKLNI